MTKNKSPLGRNQIPPQESTSPLRKYPNEKWWIIIEDIRKR